MSSNVDVSTPRRYNPSEVLLLLDGARLNGWVKVTMVRGVPERFAKRRSTDGHASSFSRRPDNDWMAEIEAHPYSDAAQVLAEQADAQEGESAGALSARPMVVKEPGGGQRWATRYAVIVERPGHSFGEEPENITYKVAMVNVNHDAEGDL